MSTFPLSLCQDGYAAVSLFFVLSGFVLSFKYLQQPSAGYSSSKTIGSFFIRRLARIYLPFLAVLALVFAAKRMMPPFYDSIPPAGPWMRSLWANPSSWSHFLQQANIFFRTDPNEHLIPQDWSLTVELTISFWMPFLIALSLQGAAALIVFSVVSVVFMQAYGFVFHFMAGILIAKYFTDVQIWLGQRTVVQKTGILISALVLYGYRYLEVQLPPGIRFSGETMGIWYLTGLGACLLLISAIGSRRIQNFLRMPILVRLGRISYSFYLIHLAVLMHFTSYFLKTINRMGMDGRILASLLGFVATFIVTFVLSDISYRMIELPSIRLGKIAQSLFFDTDRRH